MSDKQKLKVVICWHMHQPQYANRLSGEYQLPWTYLHGIKDYTDMAAHLEAIPQARAVVNFAPILLEQITDYAHQIDSHLKTGCQIQDDLLSALSCAVLPSDIEKRIGLMKSCLKAHEERLINRFEPYKRLAKMAKWFAQNPDANIYLNDQFLVDILMWYHMAWLGETVRRNDSRIKYLMDKENGYTFHDRRDLLEIIGQLLSGIINRYKKLAENGQVELAMSPYAHPIVPLLLDFNSAQDAIPDVSLPLLENYYGGEERVRWHINHGINTFRNFFGITPQGCWPSEGSISDQALPYFEQAGFRWLASGESVIRNSFKQLRMEEQSIYKPFTSANNNIACFFRDDGLSDLIGFTYSTWHADDAVANFIHNLENIRTQVGDDLESTVVSIILDGENAWEHYPENGYYFLSTLYRELVDQESIDLTTFSACLDQGIGNHRIEKFVAGSWVYGTFSTWIGDADKNRAWDMLGEAKRCFDHAVNQQKLSAEQQEAAEKQLSICEGSDWFWWFGDYNPAEAVSDFERLYRMQLVNLYQILGEEPPEYLSHVFAHGGGTPQLGGVMRRGSE